MPGRPKRVGILRDPAVVELGASVKCGVHVGEVESGGGRGAREMIALMPMGHPAVPNGAGNLPRERHGGPAPLRFNPEPGQAVDVRLVSRDGSGLHVHVTGSGSGHLKVKSRKSAVR